MLPMLLEDGYKQNGWLGMLLGTRLWCECAAPITSGGGCDAAPTVPLSSAEMPHRQMHSATPKWRSQASMRSAWRPW
jgi:hypothetical protein